MDGARRDNLRTLLILVALCVAVVFVFQAVDLWLLGSFPRSDCSAGGVSSVPDCGDTYLPVEESQQPQKPARTSPAVE
ncbi:MAG: hypothetical protein R6V19_02265 [Armatimonadota bacterium]